ncbi:MAG: ribonuclease HI family protein [bacterium]|nr:ribonuclease HI family protein [bacterium]
MNKKLIIYTDGGARGNPGPAAIGVVVRNQSGETLAQISMRIGETTNNQAEYQALIVGLNKAIELGAIQVTCIMDSELVVKQLTGQYKIKEPGLQKRVAEVLQLSHKFQSIDFKHVLREKNQLADELVNKALDAN